MSRRLFELVVRARRLVTPAAEQPARGRTRVRLTAKRQVGGELSQFSFRLALMIDLAYIGVGALGGAAVGRASASTTDVPTAPVVRACTTDSTSAKMLSPAAPNADRSVTDSVAPHIAPTRPSRAVR
jgi:hypothetical protein